MKLQNHIIFIGGWTRDKRSYRRLLKSTPEGTEVIFIPCYNIINKFSQENLADGLQQEIDKLHLEKFTIAAHSLGGYLALEYALKFPSQIERLILIDSSGIAPSQPGYEKMTRALKAQLQFWQYKLPENIATSFRIIQRPVKNIRSLRLAYVCDISSKLHLLACHTLILWGRQDQVYPVDIAARMHEEIPGSTLNILDRADHDWIIHSAERFWRAISK